MSPSGPADVSVYIENQHAHKACIGWLERSANKGKTWVIVSPKVSVPSSNTVFTWAKTGEYADGPGLRARSCVRAGTGPVVCSAAMSLGKSKLHDTGAAEPVGYMQRQVHNPVFTCSGTLSSTAAAKTATSVVDAFISNFSSTKPCSGVLQESTNGGRTWHGTAPRAGSSTGARDNSGQDAVVGQDVVRIGAAGLRVGVHQRRRQGERV